MINTVEVPVTLKIRTGVSKAKRNGVEIAKIAEDCGVRLIAVHGRTREDMYLVLYPGSAEFDTVKAIKAAVSIPVIANGDMDSCEKIKKGLDFTGCDGVIIGRAAHGAPWFPGQIACYLETGKKTIPPEFEQQKTIVLQHLKALYEFYGRHKGVRIARKHIKWYVNSLPDSEMFRAMVNALETPEMQYQAVNNYYSDIEEQHQAA